MMAWIIQGGRTLRGAGMLADDVFLVDGIIAEKPTSNARRFDAAGLLVMPGLVDIHGDAHERQFQPRPGIGFSGSIGVARFRRSVDFLRYHHGLSWRHAFLGTGLAIA